MRWQAEVGGVMEMLTPPERVSFGTRIAMYYWAGADYTQG